MQLDFRLVRPQGQWRPKGGLKPSAPSAPIAKPDIDKLARSTLDALIGLAFDDDSRIVQLLVTKSYAAPGQEGCFITVQEYDRDMVIRLTKHIDYEDDGPAPAFLEGSA